MNIWTFPSLDEQRQGAVCNFNWTWTPRSAAQLRALLALELCMGLDREDVDWLAGVSNGPALMRSFHDDGFYLPCDSVPFIAIGSMRRLHHPAAKKALGQYWLTRTGRQLVRMLAAPAARFVRPVAGVVSYAEAQARRDEVFGRPWEEVSRCLGRRPLAPVATQLNFDAGPRPRYHSFEGMAEHGRSIWQ